ncbi:DUF3800 domain-containing protein, partial [Patescibacteria group bacterium]|nr:DUF3800 domain-containing protein [Patescibacteria group bacterium]
MNQKDKKFYIFLDESGKPEIYSKKGINLVDNGTASRFLVIAAVRAQDHLALQQAVTSCRLEILNDKSLSSKFSPAYSLDSFHAQTDYPEVRQRFYEWIRDCSLDIKICAIVAEKLKAYPQLQYDSSRLYATVAGQLLKRFLHASEDIEVIFSRRDASLKTRERLQLVVDTLRADFASKHNFDLSTNVVYHHNPHYSHGGLQIADYVAYAIFQVFQKKNKKWWS